MKFKITGYKGKPTPSLSDLNRKAGLKTEASFSDLISTVELFLSNDVTPPSVGDLYTSEELFNATRKVFGSRNFSSVGIQNIYTCELYLILRELLSLDSWASRLPHESATVAGKSLLPSRGICAAIESRIKYSTCFKAYDYRRQLAVEILKYKASSTFKTAMTVLAPVWEINIYGYKQESNFPVKSAEVGVSNSKYFRFAEMDGKMYEGQYGEDRKDLLKFLCHYFYDII